MLIELMTGHLHNLPHPFGVIGLAFLVMGATASAQVIEEHDVRLPTVVSVGAVVIGGAWQLSKRFQRIDDRFESIDKKLDTLWCVRKPDQNCKPEKESKK